MGNQLDVFSAGLDVCRHTPKYLIDVPDAIADAGDSQGCYLPRLIVLDLGDGHVKLVSQPRAERAHDAALALEATVFRQTECDFANANVHQPALSKIPNGGPLACSHKSRHFVTP